MTWWDPGVMLIKVTPSSELGRLLNDQHEIHSRQPERPGDDIRDNSDDITCQSIEELLQPTLVTAQSDIQAMNSVRHCQPPNLGTAPDTNAQRSPEACGPQREATRAFRHQSAPGTTDNHPPWGAGLSGGLLVAAYDQVTLTAVEVLGEHRAFHPE